MVKKSVLIKGASSDTIGAALVLAFQQKVLTVFANVRNLNDTADLAKFPDVHVVTFDNTSEEFIVAVVEFVKANTSGTGLDISINSCWVKIVMRSVDFSINESERLFHVNIWGILAMIKAFTPQPIETKAMVVNISSVAGIIYTPCLRPRSNCSSFWWYRIMVCNIIVQKTSKTLLLPRFVSQQH